MPLSSFPLWFAAYLAVLAFVLGGIAGSALECLAWRIVHHESWAAGGRSHCPACGHTLGLFDLIPVFSWLALRGRCRYCGKKIGVQHLLCELLMSFVFLALLVRYGVSVSLALGLLLSCMLLPAALCDLETFEIPDRFAVIGAAGWALLLPLAAGGWRHALVQGLGGAALAAGVWAVAKAMEKRLGAAAMGGADIQLYALAGLYLGPALNLFNIALSCVVGLALSGAARRAGAQARAAQGNEDIPAAAFPFGPAIALSTVLCYLAGDAAVAWYWQLFA